MADATKPPTEAELAEWEIGWKRHGMWNIAEGSYERLLSEARAAARMRAKCEGVIRHPCVVARVSHSDMPDSAARKAAQTILAAAELKEAGCG